MTYKRFGPHDVILNTIVAKPDVNFMIHSGTIYYQYERVPDGDFGNKVKHVPSGHLSLHEVNINRPSDSLIYPFIEKSSTRYAWNSISTSTFDDNFQFLYGDTLEDSYPDSGSISRIYIPSGNQFSSSAGPAHANKKYITALKNVIEMQNSLGTVVSFGNLGTEEVNMICVPGIFCGSSIDKGSVELEYFITGSSIGKATDKFKDGRLFQTQGPEEYNDTQVGIVVYNQGIMILTGSHSLHDTEEDNYASLTSSVTEPPSWVNFGTGIPQVGQQLSHGFVTGSSYSVKLKGINKIPNLTMYAYSEMGKENFSNNPTFTTITSSSPTSISATRFSEPIIKNKKANKSEYADQEDAYQSTTYITKIGIYDKYKNLIAIATLANPVKKTEKRDFMFKLGIDF